MSLNIADQVLLLLLQRVHDGHITECCGFYSDEDRRVSWHTAEVGFQTLTELGRIQLTYPPGSGALRTAEYEPGELVYGVHVGLSLAERKRRASLTESGLVDVDFEAKLRDSKTARVASDWASVWWDLQTAAQIIYDRSSIQVSAYTQPFTRRSMIDGAIITRSAASSADRVIRRLK